jgi:hypothetical protein
MPDPSSSTALSPRRLPKKQPLSKKYINGESDPLTLKLRHIIEACCYTRRGFFLSAFSFSTAGW